MSDIFRMVATDLVGGTRHELNVSFLVTFSGILALEQSSCCGHLFETYPNAKATSHRGFCSGCGGRVVFSEDQYYSLYHRFPHVMGAEDERAFMGIYLPALLRRGVEPLQANLLIQDFALQWTHKFRHPSAGERPGVGSPIPARSMGGVQP